VTLGRAPTQVSIFRSATEHCDAQLTETSIYRLLHRESHRLFADEMFADLFMGTGRNCASPRILAVVMVLQRIEGLSDREAVDRFTFDTRWKYAAAGLDAGYPSFAHSRRLRSAETRPPVAARVSMVSRDLFIPGPLVQRVVLVPAQILRTGRTLICRLLAWRPELPIFFRMLDALTREQRCDDQPDPKRGSPRGLVHPRRVGIALASAGVRSPVAQRPPSAQIKV